MIDVYQKYRNTRLLLDRYHFENGLYAAELILITNQYSKLKELGNVIDSKREPLFQKQSLWPESERDSILWWIEYAFPSGTSIADAYVEYCKLTNEYSLPELFQEEYILIAMTQKYSLEDVFPYHFEGFIFADYLHVLDKLLEGDTVVS